MLTALRGVACAERVDRRTHWVAVLTAGRLHGGGRFIETDLPKW
jgi:hypothetical protein